MASCKKDAAPVPDVQLISHQWEILSIKLTGSGEQYPGRRYVLELKQNKTLDIIFEVNRCTGNFYLPLTGKINLFLGCTKTCCDSDFAQSFIHLAGDITDYRIAEDTLTLSAPASPGHGGVVILIRN